MNQQAAQGVVKAPFKACIDDSDCSDKGPGFNCFQYICYPWEDDSAIPQAHRKATCKSNENCSGNLSCFRHHDRRKIHRGLCMEPIVDCSENNRDDCKANKSPMKECCNSQYCCDEEYFNQLKMLPCVSDFGCKDLGYGNFCCPPKPKGSNGTAVCCNEDPYPTTTTRKPTTPKSKASKVMSGGSTTLLPSSLGVLLILFLLPFLSN